MWSKLLGAICTWVAYHFGDKRQAEIRREKLKEESRRIDHAAHTGDEDAVNAVLNDRLPLILFVAGALLFAQGCSSKAPAVVYVNEPDRAYVMEREGVAGWWVPNGQMSYLLQLKQKALRCTCQ